MSAPSSSRKYSQCVQLSVASLVKIQIYAMPTCTECRYYGRRFMTPTLMGGVCFGAGLGITIFGIMYMFIHDGMVHRRFPVRHALLCWEHLLSCA